MAFTCTTISGGKNRGTARAWSLLETGKAFVEEAFAPQADHVTSHRERCGDRPDTVTEVDADATAEDVEQAVLDLDIDDLGTRAGRKSWGYVEPTEAAWELLDEAIEPFLDEMKRHIELGFEAAATATCAGTVLGLHRCRGKNSDQVLGRGLPGGDRWPRGGDACARECRETASCLAAPGRRRRSGSGVGGYDRPLSKPGSGKR
jgi:hypothetical protein